MMATNTNSSEQARLADSQAKAKMPDLFTDEALSRFEPRRSSRRLNDEEMGPGLRSRSRVTAKAVHTKVLSGEKTPTSEEKNPSDNRQNGGRTAHWGSVFKTLHFWFKNEIPEEEIKKQIRKREILAKLETDYLERQAASRELALIENFPEGYPRLAAFQSSHPSFNNFRSFDRLFKRALLYGQSHLTKLEKELYALDKEYAVDNTKESRLRGYDNAADDRIQQATTDARDNKKQADIMQRIRDALVNYGELADNAYKFGKLERTSERDFRSLFTYCWYERPLATDSGREDFLWHVEDFVSLSERRQEGQSFEDLVLWLSKRIPTWARKALLQIPDDKKRTKDKYVTYYSTAALTFVAKLLSNLLVIAILLGPVYLLFLHPDWSRGMMAFICSVFVGMFVVIMSFMTDAKLHDVFVGASTYGTVLLIFLGNISQGGYYLSGNNVGNATAN